MPSNPDKPKINPRQMVKDGRANELYNSICATGYIPDEGNFSDFCQSLLSGFALLACGNPGSGKTVFTDALYEACNLDYYTVTGRNCDGFIFRSFCLSCFLRRSLCRIRKHCTIAICDVW